MHPLPSPGQPERTQAKSGRQNNEEFLAGGGETGAMIRAMDWSKTPLGPVKEWPQSLRTAVRIILTSRQPMFVWWGPRLINLYNDAYKAIVGGKHPKALGQPASEVWKEIWDQVGPRARKVMEKNVGTYDESLLLIMQRHGYMEETYYTFSYSPIPSGDGGTGGIICANSDDTPQIIGERQLAALKELAAGTGNARSAAEACQMAAQALRSNDRDIPFVLLYLQNRRDKRFELHGVAGINRSHPAVPHVIDAKAKQPWPLAKVVKTNHPIIVEGINRQFPDIPAGAWHRPPSRAVLIPLTGSGSSGRPGVLVAALNPYRLYDDNYERFMRLLAGEISAGIANAEAYESERKRAEALAELDQAKTSFFSNVSHEFRTPLTLMLGPLEDIVRRPTASLLPREARQQLETVYRNGLRLQKLVNALLDFSRIEAGRVQAVYAPIDLGQLTTDLASNFRSAVEKAGMELRIETGGVKTPAYVDKEMWEKIVLNLVSNAFKYTMKGRITVRLREQAGSFELIVQDTGIGVRAEDLPRLFDRFHRVRGTKARTHEGTGIGLSLVHELVKLHGGTVGVNSTYGKGTRFTVTVPKGKGHLPPGQVSEQETSHATTLDEHYVQEAERWLAAGETTVSRPLRPNVRKTATTSDGTGLGGKIAPTIQPAHIILADDNADMREYVSRLLSQYYKVTAVSDGLAALEAVKRDKPDLVVTDIMMPHLDGFGLLKAIRNDPDIATTQVIMLSARAGEEARIEGLDAGADDYLVKPFSARELLARVAAFLEMAHIRRQAADEINAERERLHSLFMRAPASIAMLSGPDLVFDLANPDYHRLVGVDRDVVGRPLREVMPDLEPAIWETINRVAFKGERFIANEMPVRFDWEGKGPTVKYFNLVYEPVYDEQKQPNGLMAFVMDMTEQVIARQELAESEQRWRSMAAAMPHKVFTATVDGTIDYVSPQWQTYTGIEAAEFIARPEIWQQIAHPGDRGTGWSLWRRALKTGQPVEYESRFADRAGRYRWHITHIAPIFNAEGKLTMWIGSSTDTDDMKRSIQKQQELETKAALLTEQRERLMELNRAKDEFISLASHQLRTPATGVKQYLGMLLQGYVGHLSDEQRAFLATAYESNERQITIVNDLLQVAQVDAGKVRLQVGRTDLVKLVNGIIDELSDKFKSRDQVVVFKPPMRHLPLRADEDRIRMVLENIIDNACKYTHPHKTITIGLRSMADKVRVTIRDQGVGMDPKNVGKIFNKFARLDNPLSVASEGSGLGLYWAKKIIDLHKGSIAVKSALGKGTTFTVTLPKGDQ